MKEQEQEVSSLPHMLEYGSNRIDVYKLYQNDISLGRVGRRDNQGAQTAHFI